MTADVKIQALVDEIYSRINDLLDGNEDAIVSALSMVALRTLNSKYKPDITDENIKAIRNNYPSATDTAINERGLSRDGLITLLITFQAISKIAIDYSPHTNVKKYLENDSAPKLKHILAQSAAEDAYKKMRDSGLSAYGSATTMLMFGISAAQAEGVSVLEISRPIIESMHAIFENASIFSKIREEQSICLIMNQLGISRKAAMKYAENIKELNLTGQL